MTPNCEMCGKVRDEFHAAKYQYDNGEIFIAKVCSNCYKLHKHLVKYQQEAKK